MIDQFEGEAMPTLAGGSYGGAVNAARRLSTVEKLQENKRRLEAELKNINDALDALKANPEFEKLLHLVSKCF